MTDSHSDATTPQSENPDSRASSAPSLSSPAVAATPASRDQLLDNAHITTGSLTKQLVKLHTKLWPRWLGRNKGQLLFLLLYVLYGIMPTVGFGFYIFYQALDHNNFTPLTMLLGVGVLAYWLISVTMPSAESQFDIKYFSVLPITGRQLLPGMILTSILTMRGVMVVINSCITLGFGIVAILRAPELGVPSIIAIAAWTISVIASGVLTLLGAEILATLFGIAAGRKSKERLTMMASFGFLLMIVALNLILNTGQEFEEQGATLEKLGSIFMWMPWGWPAAAVTALCSGRLLLALLEAVLATVLLVGLWRWWAYLVQRGMFVAGTESSGQGKTDAANSWVYKTPSRAIVHRWFLYVRRDLRLGYAALSLPLMSLLFLALSALGTNDSFRFIGGLMVAISATSLGSNLFGMDGPANWLHLTSPLRGRDFLRPRLFGIVLLMIPTQVIYLGVWLAVFGFDRSFLFILTVIVSGILFSWGFGALLSVYNAFPTSPPGTNPMKDRSGYSSGAWITSLGSLLGVWVPMAPGLIVMIWAWKTDGSSWIFIAGMLLCVLICSISSWIMYRLAVKRIDHTWPDIFDRVRSYV